MSLSMSPVVQQQQPQRRKSLPRPVATKRQATLESSREKDRIIREASDSYDKSMLSLTLDEGEVEANLYFPTFARRGSEVQNNRRPSTSSRLLLGLDPAGNGDDGVDALSHLHSRRFVGEADDDDEIFALDDEVSVEEELSHSRDNRVVRRVSDQSISSSSTTTSDLGMVWDEDDQDDNRDDTIRGGVEMVREGSNSSIISAPFSPRVNKHRQASSTLKHVPSLTFVRTMRRPSEHAAVSLQSYQWASSVRGPATTPMTTTVSRSNSVASIQLAPVSRHNKQHQKQQNSGSFSASNSPRTDRGNPFVPDPQIKTEKEASPDFLVGRKRRCTDPLLSCSLLDQYRMSEKGSKAIG